MSPNDMPAPLVRCTERLEDTAALDQAVQVVEPTIHTLFGTGTRSAVLRGKWLGHAVHPLLTDVVLGTWTSATLLDTMRVRDSSASAQRLVGVGLVAALPTFWTGWAEWSAAEPREKRVGLVHAVTNGVALGLYASSYVARRRGRHEAGAALGFAGATVISAGAYLGGHLAIARKVGSRDPAYETSDSARWRQRGP